MSSKEEKQVDVNIQPTQPIEVTSPDGEITLRQFTIDDARELFELIDKNREHLSQNGEDTAIKYPTLDSLIESIVHPKNSKRLRFAIKTRDNKIAGSINITPDEADPKTAEIGYYLGSEFTGKGYAGRAVETISRYGFETLGLNAVFGVVAETNNPSLSVLTRAGFKETNRKVGDDGRRQVVLTKLKFKFASPDQKIGIKKRVSQILF